MGGGRWEEGEGGGREKEERGREGEGGGRIVVNFVPEAR